MQDFTNCLPCVKNKNCVILGGDRRQKVIYEMLKNCGFNNCILSYWGTDDYNKNAVKKADYLIFPVIESKDGQHLYSEFSEKKVLLIDLYSDINEKAVIIGGKISNYLAKEHKVYDYLKDEYFKAQNAIPTSEGAICVALSESDCGINGSNCLVIGFGAIGKYLSKILFSLGANVTVSARKDKDLAVIEQQGYKSINSYRIAETVDKYDFIFNTVPTNLILSDELIKMKNNTLYIDLASEPYGINHETAKQLGKRTVIASGLPGKISPTTAAEITCKAIIRIIKEAEENG